MIIHFIFMHKHLHIPWKLFKHDKGTQQVFMLQKKHVFIYLAYTTNEQPFSLHQTYKRNWRRNAHFRTLGVIH